MNRVVHFEIQADDMDRAQKFYEAVFGWTFKVMGEEYGGYRVISTGPGPDEMAKGVKMEDVGINGDLMKRNGTAPADGACPNAYTCIIGVDNIDMYMERIEAAGGKPQTDKMDVPNIGQLRYYKDTEGNIFGILQPAPMPTK
ncbi:MAG: VOC family protein [Candidatus Adlerbacteria bacterium]|nr:VOC family protein [Candidatus Adlerbacteria bacterium]